MDFYNKKLSSDLKFEKPDMTIMNNCMALENVEILQAVCDAFSGSQVGNLGEFVRLVDSVAIVPLRGVMTYKPSFLTWYYDSYSTSELIAIVGALGEDERVETVVFNVDSPGGDVVGLFELSEAVKVLGEKKNTIALSNTRACSSACMAILGCNKRYMASETACSGSLGTVYVHTDKSKSDEERGKKVTEIYAGKYKRIAGEHKPLGKEGKEYLQDRVDYVYSLMVSKGSGYLGVSEEKFLGMAEGRLFTGQQAVDAGLFHGIDSLENIVNNVKKEKEAYMPITLAQLKEEAPDLLASIKENAVKEGVEQGLVKGAEQERTRLMAIDEIAVAGCEDIVAKAKADPKIGAAEVALEILKKQKERGPAADLAAIQADSQTVASQGVAGALPDAPKAEDAGDLLVKAIEAKGGK